MKNFTVHLDKLVALVAGIAVVVIPVLTQDHVLSSKLASDLGLALGTFIAGYHVQPGIVFGNKAVADVQAVAQDAVQAAETVTDSGSGGVPDMAQQQA